MTQVDITRFYRGIKDGHGFENKLDDIDPKFVNYLTKFITSNHGLPIKSGRWENTPFNERLCEKCTLMEMGDEFHYLFNCPHFNEKRTNLLCTTAHDE